MVTWLKNGRKFTFKNLTGYKGELRLDSVKLEIGQVKVFLNDQWLKVTGPDYKIKQELYVIVNGKRNEIFEGKDILVDRGEIKIEGN